MHRIENVLLNRLFKKKQPLLLIKCCPLEFSGLQFFVVAKDYPLSDFHELHKSLLHFLSHTLNQFSFLM